MFYRNFTDPGRKFILSLHYSGDNSYLFVNDREELKFKTKTDQIIKIYAYVIYLITGQKINPQKLFYTEIFMILL